MCVFPRVWVGWWRLLMNSWRLLAESSKLELLHLIVFRVRVTLFLSFFLAGWSWEIYLDGQWRIMPLVEHAPPPFEGDCFEFSCPIEGKFARYILDFSAGRVWWANSTQSSLVVSLATKKRLSCPHSVRKVRRYHLISIPVFLRWFATQRFR